MYTNPSLSDKNMDEILASIRQTITEEFGYREKSHSERTHMTPTSTDQDIQSIETKEDVLELTQVLQDDGTIIDLREEGDLMSSKIIVPKDSEVSLSLGGREKQEAQTLSEQELKEIHRQHQLSEHIEPLTDTPESIAASQPASSIQSTVSEPVVSSASFKGIEQETSERSEEMLVAEQTVQESLAALSTLNVYTSQSAQSADSSDIKSQSPQTLEGMVREMLRPMLKEWLDANLPSLVKWVVTEQVERICKEMRK